jgi:hypothetical protein
MGGAFGTDKRADQECCKRLQLWEGEFVMRNSFGQKVKKAALSALVVLGLAAGAMNVAPTPAHAAVQATYYVSPSGSDSNPGTLSQPFKTITKARNVVRTINNSMTGDIITSFDEIHLGDNADDGNTGNVYFDNIQLFDDFEQYME